jgi:Type I phosphodiesterase / nucleotide pyrophosphatase
MRFVGGLVPLALECSDIAASHRHSASPIPRTPERNGEFSECRPSFPRPDNRTDDCGNFRIDGTGPKTAPAMAGVRDKGINFANPHSLFPTFTTANASGMATGHKIGDTGDISNTTYTGFPGRTVGLTVRRQSRARRYAEAAGAVRFFARS